MKKILYLVALVAISLSFVQCEQPEVTGTNVSGTHEGHEYVDLGLPSGLKWATCNVGATITEGFGYHFAWGEVAKKEYYDWNTYEFCNKADTTFNKYCYDSAFGTKGFVDNKLVLDPEDDAAHVLWGGEWRMPTVEETKELYDYCKWTWTTVNGKYGCKVTGINGNYIFLPADGAMGGDLLQDANKMGYYWTSNIANDPDYDTPMQAFYLRFTEHKVEPDGSLTRRFGFPVRAVCP